MRHLPVLALLLVLLCPVSPAAETSPVEMAKMLLDYQAVVRGDADSGVKFYLARAGEFTGSPLAELAIRLALLQDPANFSAVDVGEAEARRLLAPEAGTAPEVQDLARRFVARALTHSGRRDEAMALHRQRGLAMSWLTAGTFTTLDVFRPADAGGLMAAVGPPADADPLADPPTAADFKRWRDNPPWRAVPETQSFPFVHPWRWTGGPQDGATFMRTGFNLENSDNRVEFFVFSDVSWTLYVDGAMAATVDRDKVETPLEHVTRLPLPAGPHVLTVVLMPPPAGVAAEDARFALRLATSSPFSWNRELPTPERPVGVTAREAERLGYFSELAAQSSTGSALTAAYAAAAAEQLMYDEASWSAATAAAADPENLNIQLLAGILFHKNTLLPAERRRDLSAAWYRSALAIMPDSIPALLRMAEFADAAGRSGEAGEYIERAYAVNPSSLVVLLARAVWAGENAGSAASREALRELHEKFPKSLSAQRYFASMPPDKYFSMDRRIEACRAAVAAGDPTPRSMILLAEALADSGSAEAAAAVRQAKSAFPHDLATLAWAAEAHSRLGQPEDAAATLSEALRLAPWRSDLWRRLGDVTLEQGREEAALEYWRVSLAADPGQYQLSNMVRFMSDSEHLLAFDGGYDAVALLAREEVGRYPGDVVRLLDRSMVIMERDGSFRRLTHEVDLIQTRRGGEMLADVSVPGELLTARTVFPNGESLESENIPGRSGLRLPALLPGTAREVQYIEHFPVKGLRPPRQAPWFFQHPGGNIPFLLSEYEVRVPKGMPLVKVLRDQGADIDYEETSSQTHDIYRWTARLGATGNEPDSVHMSERLASVETGMLVTWEDVAFREIRGLCGRLLTSQAMKSLMTSLFKMEDGGILSPEDSARAIYRFVCDNIESAPGTGAESASHVLIDRIGDRNLLLLAMLRAAGFNAHPAAARPSRNRMYPPAWELPHRDLFPVPLVRLSLPGGPVVWLDTRYEALPFGKSADDLAEATLVAFLPSGPLFEKMPRVPLSESEHYEERRILLPEDGKPMVVVGRSMRKGVDGLARREFMADADPAQRRLAALDSLFPVFPDAVLTRLDILRPPSDESYSLERYEIECGSMIEVRQGNVRAILPCLAEPKPVSEQAMAMPYRTTYCHIAADHVLEDRNTFVLPEGGTFLRLPKPVHILGNFGMYQLRVVRRGGNQVELIRRFQLPAQRVNPWEWKDFLRFLDQITAAELQWVEYTVAGSSEPSDQP